MGWEAWFSLGLVGAVFAGMILSRRSPDAILLGALTVLLLAGVVEPRQALSGFATEGVITIGVLFVVATGVRETGALTWLARRVLGRPRTVPSAQARVALPVAAMSAFLSNTLIVAMLLPVLSDWSRRLGISTSKVLLPLSFAAILGGMCTLIGTSTNLVVNGLLIETEGVGLGFFEIGRIGLACAGVGLVYLLIAARWLPDRRPAVSVRDDPRQYTVEMVVPRGSPLAGRSIEDAGLRHLPGLYLMEILREGEVMAAVGSEEKLREGDRLVFVGIVESVVDLQRLPGLAPATDQVFKLEGRRSDRILIEAVVSDSCPLVGRTVREGRFRSRYGAAVIAVARSGKRLRKKIGDIKLRAGDTLLLEARPEFVREYRDARDFYLVSSVEGSGAPRYERAWVAGAVLAGMVVAVTAGWVSMLAGAMTAAGLMVLTGCCTGTAARQGVEWRVLLAIGAAMGIGRAVAATGAAASAAEALIGLSGDDPWLALAAVYVVTNVLTEMVSNVAAVVLVFPLAAATAESLGVSVMPFAVALAIAGSASFSTPLGYQTNLMVYGPGGYRLKDFLRLGLPMNLLIGAVTVSLAPRIWPF